MASVAMTWKLAAVALVIALIILIPKTINDRRREREQFKADVQLWEEVNAQVSQPVPAPLKPLMQLVAWEPETVE
jgi:inner membrane protein involved in colicin E2 resistance